jgi:hypothetical protein
MTDMKKITGIKIFVGVVVLMVAAVIGVGLYVAGSPERVRDLRLDETRSNDLQQIASAVDTAYDRDAALPATLDALKAACRQDCYLPSLIDPKTGAQYEYRTTGATTYELCATFDDVTQRLNQYGQPTREVSVPVAAPYGKPYPGYRDWTHGAGRQCFPLDTQDRMATAACGLRNPCQAGQTCAQLPDKKGTFCVPAGKECLAAGCPQDKCAVSESYPVQVRCADAPAPSTAPPQAE